MHTHRTKRSETVEPMGIVISDGGQGHVTSRLAAFVWGPVPEDVLADLEAAESRDELLFASVS